MKTFHHFIISGDDCVPSILEVYIRWLQPCLSPHQRHRAESNDTAVYGVTQDSFMMIVVLDEGGIYVSWMVRRSNEKNNNDLTIN